MKKTLLFSLILILHIQTASANPPPAFEGRGLYTSYCLLCHGVNGEGDGPLAKTMGLKLTNLRTTIRSRSDTILKKIITGKGRQTITGRDRHNIISDQLPEWQNLFNEHEINSLIAYLRFLGRSKFKLMGDPKKGMDLYMKYCKVCHGEEGDGEGIMTRLMGISPMDHTNPNETDRLDNAALMRSILFGKGRYMPAWNGILSQQDVEALVSYIRLLAY